MTDEALRLADLLCKDGHECCDFQAAAELRRQHEEITQLRHGAGVANQTIADFVAQRDALLEALKSTRAFINSVAPHGSLLERVDAAIKQAEENT